MLVVKNPPANAGDAGSIPGSGEGPLEEEMAAHSSILAWRIPWTEEPGGLWSMGCIESDMTEVTMHTCTSWFSVLDIHEFTEGRWVKSGGLSPGNRPALYQLADLNEDTLLSPSFLI